jgi:hypothetical protein
MPLSVLHSFIHQTPEKTTSLTISLGDALFLTLSDKVDKLRVKLGVNEIAGLIDALEKNKNWSAFHSFTDLSGNERKSKINYSQNFFNIESEKKIAMKLSDDERLAFRKVLGFAFNKIIERKFEQGRAFGKLEE